MESIYQKMYSTLFNGVTDALRLMEQQNFGTAHKTLVEMQQKTEEIFVDREESSLMRNCPVRQIAQI